MSEYSEYYPYAFAVVVAVPFFILLRQFVHKYLALKNTELKILGLKAANEPRMQAFERMTLFLERIKPSNLVGNFDKSLAPHEFLFLTEKSISEEFDYNASQQLFISKINWQNITTSRSRIIALLRFTYENLSENATLEDFKTVFLMSYMNEGDYIADCIEELKKEMILLS